MESSEPLHVTDGIANGKVKIERRPHPGAEALQLWAHLPTF
jgi:hypothetical protein